MPSVHHTDPCQASYLPEELSGQFGRLLSADTRRLHQLHAEHGHAWATRHKILGPVLRGLQLVHEHWAYRGVGSLRRELPSDAASTDFRQRQMMTPIHDLTSLAMVLLAYVAEHDVHEGAFDTSDTEDEGLPTLLRRPAPLRRATAVNFQADIQRAYSSLHRPSTHWTRQDSERNLQTIHMLRNHSGYAQVRHICLSCLTACEEAKWKHHLTTAAAAVSKSWHTLFGPWRRCNRTAFYLGAALLSNMTNTPTTTDPWQQLKADFLAASRFLNLEGSNAMLRELTQDIDAWGCALVLWATGTRALLL